MEKREPAIDGHILVVDDSRMDVRSISRQLESFGCVFRTADSHARAIKLLETDPHITVVLLDHGADRGRVADFVIKLKSMRSDVIIVGSSSADCRDEFAVAGVDRFLLKPWRFAELIEALAIPEPDDSQESEEHASVEIQLGEADADTQSGDTDLGKANSDTSSLHFSSGQRVSIGVGAMKGWQATVVDQRADGKILLQLEDGVFVEIHQYCLEAVA